MRPRDLQPLSLSTEDQLDLDDVTTSFGLLPGGTSPLSLLSPNNAPNGAHPARTAKSPGGKAAAAAAAARQPAAASPGPACSASPHLPDDDGEENEPLGTLPRFGGRRAGASSHRPDARRQSLAIGAMFAGLTAREGLLGDSELAVGDEDIQVPLAKSGKLLGGAGNHSSLFVDPDTGDLLETQLPSPQLPSPHHLLHPGAGHAAAATPTAAAAAAAAAATPTPPPTGRRQQAHLQRRAAEQQEQQAGGQYDSPLARVGPAARAAAASARKTPAGARWVAVGGIARVTAGRVGGCCCISRHEPLRGSHSPFYYCQRVGSVVAAHHDFHSTLIPDESCLRNCLHLPTPAQACERA